ncbi:hypothetical protein L484_011701 [Morus notabilis]|uniref:At4g14310 8-bladed propeller domain-containing protein n=1 Tax=Morus notabilis TaxID=981085 RepID=W9RRS7_9ROSA|nr:KIN14B-interacting protein At4g14310 [Morus notabilis]EXB93707.1 hypothetical protein L484_011701 [Morus notabilis]
MSATSARRPKDRTISVAVAGAKSSAATTAVKSFKSVTPVPVSDKRFPTGKENSSGPISKAQKPVIRHVARVERAFSAAGNGVRWSTSSASRGRSPSPLEIRRDRRVSVDKNDRIVSSAGKAFSNVRVSDFGKEKKGFGDSGVKVKVSDFRGANGIRAFRGSKENGKIDEISEKLSDVVFDVKAIQIEKSVNVVKIDDLKSRESVDLGVDDLALKFVNGVDLGKKEEGEKIVKEVKISEGSKESKYSSKLHEKLAFLEGKVKRIASDIKRTKEMLDLNNPDASKVIVLDIQDKISGIEKAMGHVVGDSDAKMGSLKATVVDDVVTKMVENGGLEKMENNGKVSVKGLNTDELEARLFPHHKLLRNRIAMLETSSGSSLSVGESGVREFGCGLKGEDKALIPIDENPIAIEILLSLDKEQTQVTARERQARFECVDVQETDGENAAAGQNSLDVTIRKGDVELVLTTDETFEEFDDQENRPGMIIEEETDENCIYQMNQLGCKTSTGGWFVSEGESVLLAHDDGSCSFYDIVNNEEKAVYKPPAGVSPNMWRDCWVIRAPSANGCSGRYVVAASAGNALDSGFCSWDFYTKEVRAFHNESGTTPSRMVLGPLPGNISYMRNALSSLMEPETRQWWYKPCGPLITITASGQRVVKIYDIRDGEQIMKWDVPKPVLSMDYSSPLQWRNRGKVVVAEAESISLWDVNSLNPHALLSVPSSGRKISALHVNNTDAELGGGVRQRLSSSEAEGNDGVFCTHDSINILDFRHPTGVGLKISKFGTNVQSVFSRGDSVFLGCTNVRSVVKRQSSSEVQQFSLRKQRLFSTYALPECNADGHHAAITQVWGNSNNVMGVSGLGLFVFDALKDNELQCFSTDQGNTQMVREIVGPDDLYLPSFDYSASRALLISRDRPAMWRHLS